MHALLRMIKMARKYLGLIIVSFALVLFSSALTMATPFVISRLTAALNSAAGARMDVVASLSVALAGAYLIRAVFKGGSACLGHYCAWHFVPWLTTQVYDKLQKLSMRFYHDRQTGELMSRAVNDARQMELLVAHILPDMMSNVLIVILVTVALFMINPLLAALTLIPIPIIVISSVVFMKKQEPVNARAFSILGEINGALQDNISGIKEIQAFSKETHEHEKIAGLCRDYTRANISWSRNSGVFYPLIEFLTSLGTIIVIAVGGWLAVRGHMTSADIIGFVLYLSLYYQP
ncbi:MAG: ABC transporter ATP-binding protein, partial [Oscillospiraceae bacterium]|nr:ABC transporter ATP-binding protein [Oscillospiraceae bacterium]